MLCDLNRWIETVRIQKVKENVFFTVWRSSASGIRCFLCSCPEEVTSCIVGPSAERCFEVTPFLRWTNIVEEEEFINSDLSQTNILVVHRFKAFSTTYISFPSTADETIDLHGEIVRDVTEVDLCCSPFSCLSFISLPQQCFQLTCWSVLQGRDL